MLALMASCSLPPKTPLDQEPFAPLPSEGPGHIYLTYSGGSQDLRVFNRIANEFRRHRLRIAIVWQTPSVPTTEQLATFPGRNIRQFHDPKKTVMPSDGYLSVYGEKVPLSNAVALRVALAKATLR